MAELSVTNIVVTIVIAAVSITRSSPAPTRLDAPSTVTSGITRPTARFAADDRALGADTAPTCARLVLVDATEYSWQRARYRDARHVLAPTDAGLVGANTLQHWLWQRLRKPMADDVQT
jgi:hypothetical protein